MSDTKISDPIMEVRVKYEMARIMKFHPLLTEDNPYLYVLILQNPNLLPELAEYFEKKLMETKLKYDMKNQLLVSEFMERGAQRISSEPNNVAI